jgi:hypothetical protein
MGWVRVACTGHALELELGHKLELEPGHKL